MPPYDRAGRRLIRGARRWGRTHPHCAPTGRRRPPPGYQDAGAAYLDGLAVPARSRCSGPRRCSRPRRGAVPARSCATAAAAASAARACGPGRRGGLHLACSEIAANAFRPASRRCSARLWASPDRLACTITDAGRATATPPPGTSRAAGGDFGSRGRTGAWLARKRSSRVDPVRGPQGLTVRSGRPALAEPGSSADAAATTRGWSSATAAGRQRGQVRGSTTAAGADDGCPAPIVDAGDHGDARPPSRRRPGSTAPSLASPRWPPHQLGGLARGPRPEQREDLHLGGQRDRGQRLPARGPARSRRRVWADGDRHGLRRSATGARYSDPFSGFAPRPRARPARIGGMGLVAGLPGRSCYHVDVPAARQPGSLRLRGSTRLSDLAAPGSDGPQDTLTAEVSG